MKRNILLAIVFLGSFYHLLAQGIALPPTKSIVIRGEIKSKVTINDIDLNKYPIHNIDSTKITNHKGEVKKTVTGLKGVLLKDLLQTVTLNTENPKLFSEYYFVCKASDGYRVVFSWNELFNTVVGSTVYIVLTKGDESMMESQEHILMISTKDIHTGRRYVKNLNSISVHRAN